jgi:hypothetical protein
LLHDRFGLDGRQQRFGLGNNDFFGDAARHELGGERVKAAAAPVLVAAEVEVCLCEHPQHRRVVVTAHRGERRRA